MEVINFIVDNILTQAPITIGLIALLGLVLQRKSVGQTISGTFKTILGFMVLSAGSAVIVQALTFFVRFLPKDTGCRDWCRLLKRSMGRR